MREAIVVAVAFVGGLAGADDPPPAEAPRVLRVSLKECVHRALASGLDIEIARFQPWIDGQRAKVARAIEEADRHIDALAGHLTIDKIALGCALGYVDFRLGDMNWRDDHPGLAAWYKEFSARQSMKDTAPKQPVAA